jgi:rhodanese-related sulfurtransferase
MAVIKTLVLLPFKLALLPLRLAKKAVGLVLGRERDGASAARGHEAGSHGAGDSSARGGPSPPPPKPPDKPRGPSPWDVQVDPGRILERQKNGEDFVFVDVRQAAELADTGKIPGALHIPTQDLPRRVEELDRGREIIVYCAAGMRSLDAAMFLREKGFEKAFSLGGGLPHWQQDGGELVTG